MLLLLNKPVLPLFTVLGQWKEKGRKEKKEENVRTERRQEEGREGKEGKTEGKRGERGEGGKRTCSVMNCQKRGLAQELERRETRLPLLAQN